MNEVQLEGDYCIASNVLVCIWTYHVESIFHSYFQWQFPVLPYRAVMPTLLVTRYEACIHTLIDF